MHSSYFDKNTVKKKKEQSYSMSNLPPQFELNDMEAVFHQAILKQQADDNPFTFIRRSETNATILRVNHVRATMDEAQKFKEIMFAVMHKGHREFILDLSNCEFMDSTFLGAIILVSKKNIHNNGSIVLVAESQKLKVLYALKELDKVLRIYETIDEAVNEFKK
jgi:anti-sigma B factor antagonist